MGDITKFNSESTQEERRERARKAGIASGESRRRKSKMKDVMAAALASSVAETDIAELLVSAGLEPTQEAAIVYSMIQKAKQGDVRAAQFCRDTLGEVPTQGIELSTLMEASNFQEQLDKMSNEELLAMIAEGDALYGVPENAWGIA